MEDVRKRIKGLSRAQLELLAYNLYRQQIDQTKKPSEAIAIVGVGCRLPGGVNDLSSFGKLLLSGRDPVSDGLNYAGEKTISAGVLGRYDDFDAGFFEITPKEAKILDPHQRVLLECTWEALETACVAGDSAVREETGIFVGLSDSGWSRYIAQNGGVSEYTATGSATSIAAGRIAYFLGAKGPTFAVDTACSSSLIAVHLACDSLRSGEVEMALAGGVNLILGSMTTEACMAAGMLSRSGRCKVFDDSADGYVRSEGCIVFALKMLQKAVKDQDTIYGVIRGSAMNQDGRSPGLTAPSGVSQQSVIAGALKKASVRPEEVDYLEAHGTGTSLGDPIEVNALKYTYGQRRNDRTPLLIGSVKSNIGHTETVAGAAGLLKILAALNVETIPANLHFNRPNRHITWQEYPFAVASHPSPWRKGPKRRIAAVSSFGFSGTNIHMIIEESPEIPREVNPMERPIHLLTLSAKNEQALKDLTEKYRDYLERHEKQSIENICFAANTGRAQFPLRLAITAETCADLKEQLRAAAEEKPSTQVARDKAGRKKPRIGFLFTGQGAQYVGMGKALYDADPSFAAHIVQCSKLLEPQFDFPLEELLWGSKKDLLQQTRYTQPALYVLQTGILLYLKRCGITPEAVLGHSVGEFAAAHIAGVFSLEEGLTLIASRGALMWEHCPKGGMLAVFDTADKVQAFVDAHQDKISMAAFNSPRQTVVAGDPATLDLLSDELKSQNIKSHRLNVSHGFHSVQMAPMLAPYGKVVEQVALQAPKIKFVSTVTAQLEKDQLAQNEYWVNHVNSPVNYQGAIAELAKMDLDVLIEIGPGATLTTLGQICVDAAQTIWLNTQMPEREWATLLTTMGQLFVKGASIDWKGFDAPYSRRRIPLPTYPFQRKRFWLEDDMLDIPLPPGFQEKPMVRGLYTVQWEGVPLEEEGRIAGRRCMIIQQGGADWQPLIQSLEDRGAEVIRVSLSESSSFDSSEMLWNPEDTGALKSYMETQQFIDTIILAPDRGPLSETADDQQALAAYEQTIKASRGVTGLLRAYFETEGKLPIGKIYAVTAGAQTVYEKEKINVSGAILWGLGKTASLEYAHLWGALIDLPAEPALEDLEALIKEVSLSDAFEDQVAIRNGERWVARLTPSKEKVQGNPNVKADHTYLITGGLGGIGLSSAQHLADLGATSLVLLSRRGESALDGEKNSAARESVTHLRENGVTVEILAADISDAASMTTLFEQLGQAGRSPLGGVIHAAGVESASPLHELTEEALRDTIKAKTIGAWLLHRNTADLDSVDFFICCASISGVWGSGMLGAYSAGNHALDALCSHRVSLGLPALSISWGPWSEVGMATGEQGKYLVDAGLHPLRPAAAINTMFALANSVGSHYVAAEADWDKFVTLMEVRRSRPLFDRIKAETGAGEPLNVAKADLALVKELSPLSSQERLAIVRDRVREEISVIFGFDSPSDLPVDSPLFEIGADSIQAVAVKKALDIMCGMSLPTTLIFDYPTINDIARFICNTLFGEEAAAGGGESRVQITDSRESIAVVGMGCRFPGESNSPESFWNFLVRGGNGIVDQPEERMDIETFLSDGSPNPEKAYSLSTGLVKDIESFDAAFFNISPREAKTLDPQQRLVLETTWLALEHAGYAPSQLSQSPTGVYLGVAANDYLTLCQGDKSLSDSISHFATGNNLNVIAGRVSYILGLRGPSMAVDTACSSSLVALHSACLGLRNGDCDMALAGGVNAICTALGHVMLCQTQMLSPTGRCHVFDAAADGYVRGEGAGVVVLKRLSDAKRDGDSILAVIRSSAVNQDGRSSSLTAPNGPAQQEVIGKALHLAELGPEDVDYVETHGTGTALGDPIELNALDAAYGSAPGRKAPLILGAVKSNIGHLESASGIAGFIKLVLSLQNEAIPPNLNFRTWNPNTEIKREHFKVPTALMPWPRNEKPRIAAISSFGFSGTNAHVILEEAPPVETPPVNETAVDRPNHILALSAKSPASLEALIGKYSEHLTDNKDSAADIAYSANGGRSHFGYRLALIGNDSSQWGTELKKIVQGEMPENGARGDVTRTPRIGLLFTGQGAQYAGMGKALYDYDPQFAEHIRQCSQILQPGFGFPVEELLWGAKKELLQETRYTQPALYVLQTGIFAYLKRCGIVPEAVLGHSVGEFAAAYATGVFTLETGLKLIAARGALMWDHCPQGGMLVVFDTPSRVEAFVKANSDKVSIATYNSPRNTVVSGEPATLDQLASKLSEESVKTHRLRVSHGFHSVQMAPMLEPFADMVAKATLKKPLQTFFSTVTARQEREKLTEVAYWVDHVVKPVNFKAAINEMVGSGVDLLIEIGPGATLTTLGQLCVDAPDTLWLNTQMPEREWETLLNTVAHLYVNGAEIDWQGFDAPYARCRLPLPTYQFNRKRFWPEVSISSGIFDDLAEVEGLSDSDIDNLLADVASK